MFHDMFHAKMSRFDQIKRRREALTVLHIASAAFVGSGQFFFTLIGPYLFLSLKIVFE
jgi:hypothetical protein